MTGVSTRSAPSPTRGLTPRRALALTVLAVLAAGCDLSADLDIETPDAETALVLRAVLEAGRPAVVRVTESRDPFGPEPEAAGDGRLVETPSLAGATVTLWRGGRLVETLAVHDRTCHRASETTCDEATGRDETTRSGPYPCGDHRGAVAVEAGATYTLRAEAPGRPPAEATVTVPERPTIAGEELGPADGRRHLRLRLSDPAPPGHRYGLALYREFDRFPASVCAVGGRRDTVIALGHTAAYRNDFATRDPVLVLAARESGARVHFVAFPDDTFDGQTAAFDVSADAALRPDQDTGGLRLQVVAMTGLLYEAYHRTTFDLSENPFAEPSALPLNVTGGFGRVGAVAVSEVAFPPR